MKTKNILFAFALLLFITSCASDKTKYIGVFDVSDLMVRYYAIDQDGTVTSIADLVAVGTGIACTPTGSSSVGCPGDPDQACKGAGDDCKSADGRCICGTNESGQSQVYYICDCPPHEEFGSGGTIPIVVEP